MYNRRSTSTPLFLAVLVVTFVASTVTSTATSHPLPTSAPTASALRSTPTTDPTTTADPTPTSVPAAIPDATPVTTPVTPTVAAPSPTTAATAATAATPAETSPAVDVTSTDLLTIAREVLDSVIPSGWFGSADLQWGLLDGSSTLSTNNPPTIEVGRDHFEDPAKLRFILAHEWGHHVAFRYGDSTVLPGEPPVGFDAGGNPPAEMWAGCVAEVLVPEYWISTHGLPHCAPAAKEFTANFLAAGPN